MDAIGTKGSVLISEREMYDLSDVPLLEKYPHLKGVLLKCIQTPYIDINLLGPTLSSIESVLVGFAPHQYS